MTTMTLQAAAADPAAAVDALRLFYFAGERDDMLRSTFDDLLLRQRAIRRSRSEDRDSAFHNREGRALVVVGASGAGKTTAVLKMFQKHPDLADYGVLGKGCPVVSVRAPSPCTSKQLGRATLSALGYPIQREMAEHRLWEEVRTRLESTGTSVLHWDEMQHVTQTANKIEIQRVVNTLKALMVDPNWPISLVMAGVPDLLSVVDADLQLKRRTSIVRFAPKTIPDDGNDVAMAARTLVEAVGMSLDDDAPVEFGCRLLVAAELEFGGAMDLVLDTVFAALKRLKRASTFTKELSVITRDDFAVTWRTKTAENDRVNPFFLPFEQLRAYTPKAMSDDAAAPRSGRNKKVNA